MIKAPATLLPDSYWWSDSKDCSVLFLRYGWAASVRPDRVEVRTRGGRKLGGRCGSIAQGKRHVERWLLAQSHSTYRQWRERWAPPPAPRAPAEAELAAARLLRLDNIRGPEILPAVSRPAPEDDWLDVELSQANLRDPTGRLALELLKQRL